MKTDLYFQGDLMDLARVIDANPTEGMLSYAHWWEGMWLVLAAECFYHMGINVEVTDIGDAPHWDAVKKETQEMTREEFKKAMMDGALEHNCTSFRWHVMYIKQLEKGVSGKRSVKMGGFKWFDDVEKFDKETD